MSKKVLTEDLKLAADTIRGLSIDQVQKANSGHPGMPMGMADVASVLFLKHLRVSADEASWADRDRFVLSAGHGSALLYSVLHLCGYKVSESDLASFRQADSKTPGHPEYGHTDGVETTTGPLGQGCGNAVGMALAERMLAERFNTESADLVDHHTYAICGDGDLMEGVSHESFSLAGHLGLNKLILFYDSNRITIEGSTDLAYSDDVKKRFQGYGWRVLEIDAHNFDEIERAIRKAKREKEKPTIIISRSHIAQGSPNKVDTHDAHGAPLGEDEVRATKQALGLPADREFHVPDRVRELFDARRKSMKRAARKWSKVLAGVRESDPKAGERWDVFMNGVLPADLESIIPAFDPAKAVATRSASGTVLQALAEAIPQLVGGSADLAPSNKSDIKGADSVLPGKFGGRNLHFGIREHAMGAILNGMALHGGLRVYGATFFVFSDYCRPSIRLAAMMKLPVTYIFTHDSFYVGEDGPTHEPIEQLASLRCIPGLTVVRPGDPTETGAAWVAAMRRTDGPTALLLTRQDLPVIDRTEYPPASSVEKGAYVLWQSGDGDPDLTLIASGSEVDLALQAGKTLAASARVRVVSMPCWEMFEEQDEAYKGSVIPRSGKKLAIEAASSMGWSRYVGDDGQVICIDHFGASAPYKILAEKFGFTVENVVAVARTMLNNQ